MQVTPSQNPSTIVPSSYANTQPQSTAFSEAAYQSRQSSITMKTQEGDVITISAAAASGISMNYGEWKASDGAGVGFTASLMQEESLIVSVQGDLNEEELADMKKLMQELHKVSTAFYAGNLDASLHHALAIGDMGSITELDATFQYSSYAAASYMTNNHPVPEGFSDSMQQLQQAMAEDFAPSPVEDYGDLLLAQWRQLLESLGEDGETGQYATPVADQQAMTREGLLADMQGLIAEAAGKHPRLSPLALPMAEKAMTDAAAEQRVPEPFASKTARSVLQQLHAWLLS